jgi:hypothetical protein
MTLTALVPVPNTSLPYHTYDTFGLLTLSKYKLTASATFGLATGLITRTVSHLLDYPLPYVQPDEDLVGAFGASLMDPDAPLSIHILGELSSGVDLDNVPEAHDVVAAALDLLRKSI